MFPTIYLKLNVAVMVRKQTSFKRISICKSVPGFLPTDSWLEVKAKCLSAFDYSPEIATNSILVLGDSELQIGESIPNLGSLLKCCKGTSRAIVGICPLQEEVCLGTCGI